MNTKEKILAQALQSFNSEGSDQVSLRRIASAIGISHGNLCYHFSNTDVIIEALYFQLVEELNLRFEQIEHAGDNLQELFELSSQTFPLFYRYRFLLLDFTRILRRSKSIRNHFRQLVDFRQRQLSHTLQQLQSNQLLIPERSPGMYERLIQRMLILGDYWLPHAEVHHDGSEEEKIVHYQFLLLSMLEPYFTEKGMQDYDKIVQAEQLNNKHL
jgi:AcrR family transcriptional regulator